MISPLPVRESNKRPNAKCYSCDAVLIPVFNDGEHLRRKQDFPQFENALVVQFQGGYGMYVDPILYAENGLRVVLCGTCASQLKEQIPWVKRLFDEADPLWLHE